MGANIVLRSYFSGNRQFCFYWFAHHLLASTLIVQFEINAVLKTLKYHSVHQVSENMLKEK